MINYGESEKLVSQHITNGDTDAAEIQKSYYYRIRKDNLLCFRLNHNLN